MVDFELTFKDNNGHLLVIMPTVVTRLLVYRQLHWNSKEAAGVLIGERRGPHLVVQDISEPGNGDIRSRYSVDRRGSHHQTVVDEAFIRSSGTLQYLGEWHTHPEDKPSPSAKDLSSWRRHLVDSEQMLLVIVGREEMWAAKKIADTIIPLNKI
ncbi:CBASS system CD-NTase/cGAS isopeptidase Cap3 [Undibacterium luofuense]|uniref:Mov34/MPN/PAD-1 family protein n=1 Tax=Undibacterium luofuense TaxID=2828733 RepID=A0A941I6R5_9BURK|nr:Mov34/MPN/PAD-1 family protein [Undibacterium luofuense]MBR7781870.1 Mov34/MPN/PAD-1 family protein [Undibacterium luofuense]